MYQYDRLPFVSSARRPLEEINLALRGSAQKYETPGSIRSYAVRDVTAFYHPALRSDTEYSKHITLLVRFRGKRPPPVVQPYMELAPPHAHVQG